MNIKEKIKAMKLELESLEPYRKRYYDISYQLEKLEEKESVASAQHNLSMQKIKCDYIEPQYPSIGVLALDGSAYFSNNNDAELLVKYLNELSSYYYLHKLEWTTPGFYKVEPSYQYDHDKEIVYTAVFKRAQ